LGLEVKYEGTAPVYATEGSAGADLCANVPIPLTIAPNQRMLIPTGLKVAIPKGYEMQIRPRSGMAVKYGITVLNTPGTIDSDFRGEVQVLLYNTGDDFIVIEPHTRIAQAVICPVIQATFVKGTLDTTSRGEGGFGSTGSK